ncbi:hypothetical protein M513_09668 [Trichuris suis]|nr:hypothetical protein M513_09668 [Trichuris suis]
MPMEAEEMIARFSLDLNLPGEIFQTAVDVLRRLDISKVVNLHDDALPKFTPQRMPIPLEMKAMCIIIIALKGLFKLNDCHEQEMALEALRRYENKDIEGGRLPFLFPCWLLHNELKMAIMEGSSVEDVLSPAWFDCNAKIVNRVMVEFYTVSHLRRRDHIKNHVLGDIFQSASYSFGRIGPEPFSFRSMPRRFESLLVKHSPALDRDTVALFCFDFASTFVADCPEFPDGKNYGFYPLISHSSSDNRSYQFKHMSLTIFSASFNRVLELCSRYLFCLPNLLFLALQNTELELTPSLRIRLVTTCSASKALSPLEHVIPKFLEIGMWNVALSRAELFLNKVSSCETEKKRLSHAILRNISEQGYSSWEEVVMVIAQEMNVEVNQSLRDNLNEYRRSALESSLAMSQAQQFQLHWIFHCENNLSEWPTVASKQPIWSKPLSLFASNLNGYKVFVNSASFTFFIFVCTLSYVTDNALCVQLLRALGFLLAYFNSVLYTCFLAHFIACQRIRSAWQNWLNLFLTEKELETVQVPMEKTQNGRLRTTMLLFAFHHFMLVFFGDAVPVVMSSMTLLSLVMLTLIANELPSQWRLYVLAESVLILLLGHVKIADVLQLSASQTYLLRCSTTSFAVALSLCGTLLGKIFSFSSLRQCSILSITLWQVWLFTLMAQLDQTVGHRLHWLFYFPCFAILFVFLLWMTSTISWELIAKVFLSMAIVFIAVKRMGAVDLEEKVSDLTWSAFESQCGSSLLSMDNRIIAQEKCSALRGTIVQWKGIVHTVQIYSLPPDSKNVMLGHWLTDLLCDAGECNEENKSVYEIEISGPWGEHVISSAKGKAYLMAVGSFRPFIVYLREGDVIQFRASFTDCLGKYPPRLNLLNTKCISCGKELHDALNDNTFPGRLEASDHLFLRFASLLLLLALIVV